MNPAKRGIEVLKLFLAKIPNLKYNLYENSGEIFTKNGTITFFLKGNQVIAVFKDKVTRSFMKNLKSIQNFVKKIFNNSFEEGIKNIKDKFNEFLEKNYNKLGNKVKLYIRKDMLYFRVKGIMKFGFKYNSNTYDVIKLKNSSNFYKKQLRDYTIYLCTFLQENIDLIRKYLKSDFKVDMDVFKIEVRNPYILI